MRRLVLVLDALPALRAATGGRGPSGLTPAATLADLAGVHTTRIGLGDELHPVTETDVLELRRASRELELRMPPSPALLKVALEARPDRVLLAARELDGPGTAGPLDLSGKDAGLTPVLRSLEEAGIPVHARVAPRLDAVKAAHGLGVRGVELHTGRSVDLPAAERQAEWAGLGDAARLASKLRLELGVGGGLGPESLPEVLGAAPSCDRVAVGRAALLRALLVGLDRSLRDLRELLR